MHSKSCAPATESPWASAALHILTQCIAETANVTHRIVTDAILGLGVLSDSYLEHQLDEKIPQVCDLMRSASAERPF
jgi:hypothetical protein